MTNNRHGLQGKSRNNDSKVLQGYHSAGGRQSYMKHGSKHAIGNLVRE